jgi:uncharacterized membrane protein YcaP (DUF421 family)
MPDFAAMFVPTLPFAEIVLRASIMYLLLFLAMRFLLKREGGALNIADLLVVVAIVDGAQPAFNGDAQSITESAIFVLTIIFWSYALNWASFRYPALRFLTAAPPLILIENGKLNRVNLRRVLMTREELDQQLRESGVENPADVRLAMMEGDGTISVVPIEAGTAGNNGGASAALSG